MCDHVWREVHEATLILGGHHRVGYMCIKCGEWISQNNVKPGSVSGTMSDEVVLYGPHGGCGQCSDGSTYKRQIYNRKTGKLTIER